MRNELTGEEISDSQLKKISSLGDELVYLTKLAEDQEKVLNATKEKLNNLQLKMLPDAMLEIGMTEFKLLNGKKITMSKFYSASISEERAEEAFTWLKEHGHASIIKSEVKCTYTRGEQDKVERVTKLLAKAGIPFNLKDGVHHMTLKAFIREQIESGKTIPADLFGLYIGNKVTVS